MIKVSGKKPIILATVLLVMGLVATSFAGAADKPPTPDEALKRLQEGNARYAAGKSTHPRADNARRAATVAEGQHPIVSVLGCSDSRAPVEMIFDQGIGDVFVVRVAGNICDVDEVASVEYGVGHLHTPLVVVLGHTLCGAVTAVIMKDEVHGNIPLLVENIGPAAEKARKANPKSTGKDLVPAAIKMNVWQSIEDMYTRSPTVRDAVKGGQAKVVGAVYDLKSGQIEWLGPHPEEKRLLSLTSGPTGGQHK